MMSDQLMALKLELYSPGSIETYINKFQTLANQLEKLGVSLTDNQLKNCFLNNITNQDYSNADTFCRLNKNKSYKQSVLKICAEAAAKKINSSCQEWQWQTKPDE